MLKESLTAIRACIVSFVLCACVYPVVVWAMATTLVPHRAAGSLITGRDRTVVGSSLVAQAFTTDRYFHPRPSAVDYKADAAGGSNFGPKNPALRERIIKATADLGATSERTAPVDLVTTSGSGLDPDISPESARFQAARVAAARKRPPEEINELIERSIDQSGWIIGAPPRVNVLLLNLALDGGNPPK